MKTRSSSGAGGAHTGLFGYPRILMQLAGGAGGGAGGTGEGSGGEGTGDDGAPKTKKELVDLISATVHSAITNRSERDKKARAKEIGDAVAAALAAAGLGKKPDEEGEGAGAGAGGDQGAAGGSGGDQGAAGQNNNQQKRQPNPVEAQLYRLQKDHEALKKQAADERVAREKAEALQKRNEETTKIRGMLAGKVKEELLEAAVKLVQDRIVRDPDSDEIMWKGEKWSDREGADNSPHYEGLDLGFTKWMDGTGKHFAPPKQVGGGGTGRTGVDGKIRGQDGVASDEDIGGLLASRPGR